jgi:NAD(P)H dehydrogenase (quinone)
VRNGWHTENYTRSLARSLAPRALIGAWVSGKIFSAARADDAKVIATAALDVSHAGMVNALAGDTAHTMAKFAANVSNVVRKSIPYNDLSQDAYHDILVSFGLPQSFTFVLADSNAQAKDSALFDDSHTLSRLIGRPTSPISGPISDALKG